MDTPIIETLRTTVTVCIDLRRPLLKLASCIDFCDDSAVLALAGEVPEASPMLAELRTMRSDLAALAASIEIVEQSIVRRRQDIYQKKLEREG